MSASRLNELHLLAMLKAVGMAVVVTTPSGHHAIALLDQPNGSQVELVMFSNKHLEDHLKAHLVEARELLGLL